MMKEKKERREKFDKMTEEEKKELMKKRKERKEKFDKMTQEEKKEMMKKRKERQEKLEKKEGVSEDKGSEEVEVEDQFLDINEKQVSEKKEIP